MTKKIFKNLILLLLFVFTITILINNYTFVNASSNEITLNIYKKNVSHKSELYIIYAVEYEGIDIETNEIKLLFWNNEQAEYIKGTESYISFNKGTTTIDDKKCIIFYSEGIAAKQMTEEIYARAYIEIEGKEYYSEVEKYSILDYALNRKESGKATELETQLLDAMLEYGSLAQQLLNYNTGRLANSKYYKIEVTEGKLLDGTNYGRYQEEETVTLVANNKEGYKFVNWTDSNGNEVSTEQTFELTVTESNTYTANYVIEIDSIILNIDYLKKTESNSYEEYSYNYSNPSYDIITITITLSDGYVYTDDFILMVNGEIIPSSKYSKNNNVITYKFPDPNWSGIY